MSRLIESSPTRVGRLPVDAVSYASVISALATDDRRHGYVCCANVHMAMEAYDDDGFAQVVDGARLVTPDGMPLVWALRLLRRIRLGDRVYGPTLSLEICAWAARQGVKIGLYGGRPDSLERLQEGLRERCSGIDIAYAWAPPFRPLTKAEDAEVVEAINAAQVEILFVGLGCPKQECWMAAHQDRLPCLQFGVGAFFDFFSGSVRQAPAWMQRSGLEWLFRLLMEPRRLWRRYAVHNPRFVWLLARQLGGLGIGRRQP